MVTPWSYKHTHRRGFTIVELLIVVVVIAILAAITIVAYNGVTSQAQESSLKSDLRNNKMSIEQAKVTVGSYPVDQAAAQLKANSDNTLVYKSGGGSFCLQGQNGTKRYYINSEGSLQQGNCPPMAWVSKGAAGPSCGSNCYYVVLNTAFYPPTNYQVRCVVDGTPINSFASRALATEGSVQLGCYVNTTSAKVTVEIQGQEAALPLIW